MVHEYSKVLQEITPPQQEQQSLTEATEFLIDLVTRSSSGFPLHAVVPCGSVAKGTNLKSLADIDLFVVLNTTEKRVLTQFTRQVGKRVAQQLHTKLTIAYADNPYGVFSLQHKQKATLVNLVPTVHVSRSLPLKKALQISGMARTPLHTVYAKRNFLGLEDHIRLLKYFARQKGVYGIFGLTGWLCELLIFEYKTFPETLRKISNWNQPIIDIRRTRSLKFLRKKFPTDLVILTDPIDSNRNAAAGIQGFMGKLVFDRLKRAAQVACETPASTFEKLVPMGNVSIELERGEKPLLETTAVSLVGGFVNKLAHTLQRYNYLVEDTWIFVTTDPARVLLLFNQTHRPIEEIQGPPTSMRKATELFLEKHKNDVLYKKERRWWARKSAKYPNLKDAIEKFMPSLKGFYTVKAVEILQLEKR